jgi:hypothetical protein
MKIVVMKTTYAGPGGVCQPGQRIHLDNAEADALVTSNCAVYYGAPVADVKKTTTKKNGQRK